jgi:hypothetical protein
MSNIEALRPIPAAGNGLVKLQHNLEGLAELFVILDQIRNCLRGVDSAEFALPPPEKTPNALLDIADTEARYLAKCHQLASDIRQIVL